MLQVLAASERSMWCRPRSLNWWEEVQSGRYGDMWWKENLHMSRATFDILCRELRPHIERQSTYWRQSISVEKRVAVTLWKLATNAEYRTLSVLFGIGWSTVCVTVIETCNAIANTCSLDMFISLRVTDSGILLQILKPAGDFHKLLVPLMELIFLLFFQQRMPLTITIGKDTIPS